MLWERPPVEVSQHHVGSLALFNWLAEELFEGSTSSSGEATVTKGEPLHLMMRGAAAALSYAGGTGGEAHDMADELDQLLAALDRWGSVRVRVVR